MNPEEWRPIPEYNGRYSVSNTGKIRSEGGAMGSRAGRILSPHLNSKGYERVGLTVNRKTKNVLVHRIVAEVFIGEASGMTVNHKDFDKTNNHVSNLEYLSARDNHLHAKINGKIQTGQRVHSAKLTNSQAIEIYERRKSGERGVDLAKEFKVSPQTVSGIVNGHRWQKILGGKNER